MLNRQLTILYGSETGTAQDIAEQIWRESKMFHFKGPVLAMDAYNVKNLINEQLVVFVCSTTGQGDEPDNMKSFWKFLLRKSLPSDSLEGLKFAVLGLGDSSYTKFNFVAKRLYKRLVQLGGSPLISTGLCDDQHDLGLSAISTPWLKSLWRKLDEVFPAPPGLLVYAMTPRQYRWNVKIIDDDKENNLFIRTDEDDIYSYCMDLPSDGNKLDLMVESNIRTTSEEHFQDVRLISFESGNANWNPGDVLLVRPTNDEENVKRLFTLFKEHNLPFTPETIVEVKEIDNEMPVPDYLIRPLSLNALATQLWDLNTIPRPRVFQLLALNCTNDLEKEKLLEFTTPEGQEDLFAYANRPRRTILEVLHDFPHATSNLKIEVLFELFQPIKPRAFSIASCVETRKLELLVAVVEYKTKLLTPRRGLCSNWLKNLNPGDNIKGWLRRGTFKFPKDENIPLIMVGPGTGLAPFRSVLLHKEITCPDIKDNMVLFFGCRGKNADFHCKVDLERMQQLKILQLFTAFSRDQENKIYVQHRIKEQGAVLKKLMKEKNGVFLVAGNSKNMPQDVKEALGVALDDPEYVNTMIKTGQYQEETW